MWHEARKQERRIRGMIVDYRKRAERRQDFYEKIQADPTQFIQVHGRRCKIHLDPSVALAGDGAAIIVPWQGQQDNLIDRFDVRAHLDYIAPITKTNDGEKDELSLDERQCNYERYRILAQNDFLHISEEKFLHQLYLEEQFGANAQLEIERTMNKKRGQKSGVQIGFSYDEGSAAQPFSHVINVPTTQAQINAKKVDKNSDTDSDSDMDMDVSIDVSKLDTTQAHELNGCGRNYGMSTNDFYSYLTKDADEADALRIAREEEQEKMLLSGRKSRRERRAQKERRIACRPFSPPSYAAKEEAVTDEKQDSDSRSVSPADANSGKITYITSFGGEDELQPHTKISINLTKVGQSATDSSTSVIGGTGVGVSVSGKTTYAQKVKDNLEKLKSLNEANKKSFKEKSRSRSYSRGRGRQRRSRSKSTSLSYYKSRRRYTRSTSRHRKRQRRSRTRTKSRSRSRTRSRTRSRSRSRSRSTTRSRSHSRYSRKRSTQRRRRRYTYSDSTSSKSSRSSSSSSSSSRSRSSHKSTNKSTIPVETKNIPIKQNININIANNLPLAAVARGKITTQVPCDIKAPIIEPLPPPPLKRYYGRKRADDSSTDSDSNTNDDANTKNIQEETANKKDTNDALELDTTTAVSMSQAATSTSGKETGKFSTTQAKNPSLSIATETKVSKNHQINFNCILELETTKLIKTKKKCLSI